MEHQSIDDDVMVAASFSSMHIYGIAEKSLIGQQKISSVDGQKSLGALYGTIPSFPRKILVWRCGHFNAKVLPQSVVIGLERMTRD